MGFMRKLLFNILFYIIFRLNFISNFVFLNLHIHFKALLLICSYIKSKSLEVGHKFSDFVC